jgi:ribosome-binding protein aMBF1 (putative translation factor)
MANATNSNSTSTDTNSTSSKNNKFRNFSAIEEHELDYKKRLRSSEFTEGLSKEELIEKANSSKTASSANKIQSERTRVKPTRIQDRTS